MVGFVVGWAHARCSGINKLIIIDFGLYLFLTGIREVPEESDTSVKMSMRQALSRVLNFTQSIFKK